MSEKQQPLKITVIGTGYLGATHAVAMAALGYDVLAVDVDSAKIASLNSGHVPFFEPELDELLQKALANGNLSFTTSFADAGAHGDIQFLCVGTPQLAGSGAADLSQVFGAVDALSPHLRPGTIIVGKSTVPVGTATKVAARLAQTIPASHGVEVAWNPEFLQEGRAVQDTLHPDRLVLGVNGPHAEAALRKVYAPMLAEGTPLLVTDYATAELVKVAANSFLATKISFINAMAEVCEAAGGDVVQLAEAIGYDERIGNKFLRAGAGFGGGCLPKDIRAFQTRADELGVGQALDFLDDVDAINLRRRERVVALARNTVGGSLEGKNIAVLGVTFKPDSDDVRDSPALAVIAKLTAEGATVRAHDPIGLTNAARALPGLNGFETVTQALVNADVVIQMTEWSQYRELDTAKLAQLVRGKHIIDARNTLDPATWRASGWTFQALGRPNV